MAKRKLRFINKFNIGDALSVLKEMPSNFINTCVTSPPYWGLRDYGETGQLGLEETPEKFVEKMVGVFREVKRVLKDDGTLWLNLGDTYNSPTPGGRDSERWPKQSRNDHKANKVPVRNLKTKDLCGIPWRMAFALQSDGWYLRQDIIWHKPNPMPESVTDRCTKAHEYIFLLSKNQKYFYNVDAIREETTSGREDMKEKGLRTGSNYLNQGEKPSNHIPGNKQNGKRQGFKQSEKWDNPMGRNKRSVWTIPTQPFPDAHFATFPEDLIDPCIKAGCPKNGIVLDPFMGSGTVARVARKNSVKWIGIELNPEYVKLAKKRNSQGEFFEAGSQIVGTG